jgi:hypothetical protein
LEAVHDGHADVHENAVEWGFSFCGGFFVETNCFGAIAGRGVGKTGALGEGSQEFEIDWIVIYEEETFEPAG